MLLIYKCGAILASTGSIKKMISSRGSLTNLVKYVWQFLIAKLVNKVKTAFANAFAAFAPVAA